jgi:hypothetical protein
MGRTAILAGVYLLLFCPALMGQFSSPISGGQERSTSQAAHHPDLPTPKLQYRPKLPLQDALKIAEAFIDKEHIDISSYWLSNAHFILYGPSDAPDQKKIPCWHFLWTNDNGSIGDYVEILVDMDGRAWGVPSM